MGRPKALLDLDGAPLIVRHIEALARRAARIRVVVGHDRTRVTAALPQGIEVIHNPNWASTDPATSLRLALADLVGVEAVLVTPVDVPPAPQGVLDALLEHGAPAVPTWGNADGHPVLIEPTLARQALQTSTLRDALRDAGRVPVPWPDTLLNLNTPEQWRSWIEKSRD